MRFIKQILIIFGVTFLGELLHDWIPLPVPASIYGLVLMFLCLHFHIFPLSAVQETGDFLIDVMPALFIPASVGIIASWDVLWSILPQVLLITVVSLVAVMAVTGRVTQRVIRHEQKKGETKHD